MNMKIEQMLERIRIEYEDAIGECIEPNCRRRDKVEVRSALANAIRPYATFRQISDMLGKGDHSTVVHMMKQHEVYTASSPFYRYNYSMALKVIEEFASKHNMIQRVMLESSVLCVKTELETLDRTINQLTIRRAKIQDAVDKSLDVSNLSPTFVHN